MRFTCLAPIGVPHYVRQDVWTSDRKYLIPAGTTVFPNLYQITHNHEVFEAPHEFRPERFLDQNNKFVKHDHNLVFGTGEWCKVNLKVNSVRLNFISKIISSIDI